MFQNTWFNGNELIDCEDIEYRLYTTIEYIDNNVTTLLYVCYNY